MTSRNALSLLSFLVCTTCPAQPYPTRVSGGAADPNSLVNKWRWFQHHKQVTHQFPTDYQVGGLYRLKRDIIVDSVGTDSPVSPYWVRERNAERVEEVKEELRAPQVAGDRQTQALREVAANNPRLAAGIEVSLRRMGRQRETRTLVTKGTMLRFRQIWLNRSFEMGVYVRCYTEILGGPLQGKWADISSLSDCEAYGTCRCNLNPEYLERIAK